MTGKRTLVTFAVSMSILLACSTEPPDDTGQAAVRPVKLVTLEQAGAGQSRSYPATIEAAQSAQLAFQVAGLIEEIPVTETQAVERGQLLARLEPRDFQSQVDSAKAEFDNAESDYQRAVRLAEGDAIAAGDVEQRLARRDTARAALDRAGKALGDTQLRAPFDGVVANIQVERFQNIQAKENIVTLIGGMGFEATINLPSSVIITSQELEETAAFVVFEAAPSIRIPATLTSAELEADTASQTYEVTFAFDPPEDLLILPGMNATLITESTQVKSDEESAVGGVAVPLSAVMDEGDRSYVWVIDEESMTAARRWVTLQAGVGEIVVVTEGLAPGETIAGAGGSYLAEGMKVRAWTD